MYIRIKVNILQIYFYVECYFYSFFMWGDELNAGVIFSIIGAIGTMAGVVFGYSNYVNKRDEKIKHDVKVSVKLDEIILNLSEIKTCNKEQSIKIEKIDKGLTKIESSVKSAHKRIDDIQERNDKKVRSVI